ncbi:MAG: hypothetical protein WD016_09425 [Balneolaceae bacterium]
MSNKRINWGCGRGFDSRVACYEILAVYQSIISACYTFTEQFRCMDTVNPLA